METDYTALLKSMVQQKLEMRSPPASRFETITSKMPQVVCTKCGENGWLYSTLAGLKNHKQRHRLNVAHTGKKPCNLMYIYETTNTGEQLRSIIELSKSLPMRWAPRKASTIVENKEVVLVECPKCKRLGRKSKQTRVMSGKKSNPYYRIYDWYKHKEGKLKFNHYWPVKFTDLNGKEIPEPKFLQPVVSKAKETVREETMQKVSPNPCPICGCATVCDAFKERHLSTRKELTTKAIYKHMTGDICIQILSQEPFGGDRK